MSLKRRIGDLVGCEPLRPYTSRWLVFGLLRRPRPAYLVECWRFPNSEFPPTAGCLLPGGQGTATPDVLFLPMTDWHARTQRTQQLVLALASAGHRCFYLNPHLGFQFPRVYPLSRHHRMSVLAPRILEVHVRLPREPVIHDRMPTPQESRTLARVLIQLAEAAGSRRLVQIVSLPFWLDAALEVRETLGAPVVYDCHDHLGGFTRVGRELVEREAELLRCCDRLVFSSLPLMQAKTAGLPELMAKSRLIRNAAVAARVGQPHSRAKEDGVRPSKVIGYVGALDHWFDIDAVRQAARRHPEWKFVLAGRVEHPAIWDLQHLPNVELAGEVPHTEVAALMAAFDVGLIPFLLSDLTLAANPIKLYEYFSHGIPVVSSDLPEVRMYSGLVYTSRSASEFAEKLETAAAERDDSARQRRIAIANRETWDSRAHQFRSVLREL